MLADVVTTTSHNGVKTAVAVDFHYMT